MDFLSFIKEKQLLTESLQQVQEAFKPSDFGKAQKLIHSLFKKEIKVGRTVYLGEYATTIKGDHCISLIYAVIDEKTTHCAFSINFSVEGKNSAVPYSVSIYDDKNTFDMLFGGKEDSVKAALNIDMMGSSIVYYIPVITSVINSGKYDISPDDAVKLGRKVYDTKNECVTWDLYYGAKKYTIYEGMPSEKVAEAFHLAIGDKYKLVNGNYQWVNETELEDRKKAVRGQLKAVWANGGDDKELYKEYRAILAAIKGGAQTIDDMENMDTKANITRNVNVRINAEGVSKASEEVERHKSDPKTAFKEMQMYVKMVIKGIQPAVILCGAPGVGKTYRILQQLKAAGYTMTGDNMIKGKCSPRQLYLTLYNNQDKGDIVVIDDADGLVGPKAPEDCINILKAALDSTADDKGRLVSYKISGELKDDEGMEIPKYFYTKAGVIVITNYSVGQLDSALRNRAFTQSLDFDTKDLLEIVKSIMPNIEPNKLSMKSKEKAMDFLNRIVEEGKPIEVSIRSFITCARIYENAEDDEELVLCEKMIAEQMRNMAAKKGKHF